MSIITKETSRQREQDPSYIDTDLQWAWARGYTCGATRPPTDREINAAALELFTIDCNHAGQYWDIGIAWDALPETTRNEYRRTVRRLTDAMHHAASTPEPDDEATPPAYELTLTRNDGDTVTIGNIHDTGDGRTLFTPSSEAVRDHKLTLRILDTVTKAIRHESRHA